MDWTAIQIQFNKIKYLNVIIACRFALFILIAHSDFQSATQMYIKSDSQTIKTTMCLVYPL